jgi:hypothetical protein
MNVSRKRPFSAASSKTSQAYAPSRRRSWPRLRDPRGGAQLGTMTAGSALWGQLATVDGHFAQFDEA